MFLITFQVAHLSWLSKGEGAGGNVCCGHNSWTFDPLLLQGKKMPCCVPALFSTDLVREGSLGFICTSISPALSGLPRARVHGCAAPGHRGGFCKNWWGYLVFPLLPSAVVLPAATGAAAGTSCNAIGLLLSHQFGKWALLFTWLDFNFKIQSFFWGGGG